MFGSHAPARQDTSVWRYDQKDLMRAGRLQLQSRLQGFRSPRPVQRVQQIVTVPGLHWKQLQCAVPDSFVKQQQEVAEVHRLRLTCVGFEDHR